MAKLTQRRGRGRGQHRGRGRGRTQRGGRVHMSMDL